MGSRQGQGRGSGCGSVAATTPALYLNLREEAFPTSILNMVGNLVFDDSRKYSIWSVTTMVTGASYCTKKQKGSKD